MNALQLNLRNAIVLARHTMKLTEENFQSLMNSVVMLSPETFLVLRIGEDVLTIDPSITLVNDMLVNGGLVPASIVFQTATYPAISRLTELVTDGTLYDFTIRKDYPSVLGVPQPSKFFTSQQLPIDSNNFTVTVTLQPGGSFKRTVLLFDMGC